ncbi:hypothetical protein [Actinoallomurus sp. CA-150999]|uniref:hypothetical protein n=1 Tax=Actinoallomurus sp. CA-150999 TaxID=3239887 RepID=UPI003D91209E
MRRSITAAIATCLLLAGCSSTASQVSSHRDRTGSPQSAGTPTDTAVPEPTSTLAPGSCHASSLDPATTHPDPHCTPGALNPAVTQATIHNTICVAGYTKTIRPPVAYTDALKRQQIREYGYSDTNPRSYEEDHFLPLSLGGNPTDPHNLWPEPGNPNPKDRVEFELYKRVCAGAVTLAAAQKAILADWTTALRATG